MMPKGVAKDMSAIEIYSKFTFGEMSISYVLDTIEKQIGLLIHPVTHPVRFDSFRSTLAKVREVKNYTDGIGVNPPAAYRVEPLIPYAVAGTTRQGGLSAGISLRNSQSSDCSHFVSQSVQRKGISTTIVTVSFNKSTSIESIHKLTYCAGDHHVTIASSLHNKGTEPVNITMAQGVNLGFISPYAQTTQSNRLKIHRMRGGWSNEGRVISETLESLGLEQSWSNHALRCERFGQAGSIANLRWFPIVAVEDEIVGAFWGFKLATPASWQIEVASKDDMVCISGGFADQEFGHWGKLLKPNEELTLPEIFASTAISNTFLEFAQRIPLVPKIPSGFKNSYLGVVFNDWCSVWGATSAASVIKFLPTCEELQARYFVIDAGWYAGPDGLWAEGQGDWIPSTNRYPKGLAETCLLIRKRGIIPGLWFELEVVGPTSTLWKHNKWLLHKDGVPIQVGSRRFLDLRKKDVLAYLEQRICTLIESCRLGYLKIDANESIGIGIDGNESAGEELRKYMEGLAHLINRISERFPDLVIENCAAGALRLEPFMVGLTTITSATDAHEITSIPVIVANTYHMAEPYQLLVWTVLRQTDDSRRLHYTLAAAFLGIMCLSGDIDVLHGWQRDILKDAIELHATSQPFIREASIRLIRDHVSSYLEPKGYQAVFFEKEQSVLIVVHSFAREKSTVILPLGKYHTYKIGWQFSEDRVSLEKLPSGDLLISQFSPFSALVVSFVATQEATT